MSTKSKHERDPIESIDAKVARTLSSHVLLAHYQIVAERHRVALAQLAQGGWTYELGMLCAAQAVLAREIANRAAGVRTPDVDVAAAA